MAYRKQQQALLGKQNQRHMYWTMSILLCQAGWPEIETITKSIIITYLLYMIKCK